MLPFTKYNSLNNITTLIKWSGYDFEMNRKAVPKDIYNQLLIKCKKNKTRTCRHKFSGSKQYIYMDMDGELFYRLEHQDTYGILCDGSKKEAYLKIANWFLKCKYNPTFKYCRDRMDDLYNQEFDEDYVEGEKICL